MEVGCEIEALVSPVEQIAAGWAVADTSPIDIEDEAIVGTDANGVAGGHGAERECVAKVQNDGLAQGRRGMSDPPCVPGAGGRIGDKLGGWRGQCGWRSDLREGLRRDRAKGRGKNDEGEVSADEEDRVSIHEYRPMQKTDQLI